MPRQRFVPIGPIEESIDSMGLCLRWLSLAGSHARIWGYPGESIKWRHCWLAWCDWPLPERWIREPKTNTHHASRMTCTWSRSFYFQWFRWTRITLHASRFTHHAYVESWLKLRLHIRVMREAWCVLHDSTCTSKCEAWCVKVIFAEGANKCGSPVAFIHTREMAPYLSIYKRLMTIKPNRLCAWPT